MTTALHHGRMPRDCVWRALITSVVLPRACIPLDSTLWSGPTRRAALTVDPVHSPALLVGYDGPNLSRQDSRCAGLRASVHDKERWPAQFWCGREVRPRRITSLCPVTAFDFAQPLALRRDPLAKACTCARATMLCHRPPPFATLSELFLRQCRPEIWASAFGNRSTIC